MGNNNALLEVLLGGLKGFGTLQQRNRAQATQDEQQAAAAKSAEILNRLREMQIKAQEGAIEGNALGLDIQRRNLDIMPTKEELFRSKFRDDFQKALVNARAGEPVPPLSQFQGESPLINLFNKNVERERLIGEEKAKALREEKRAGKKAKKATPKSPAPTKGKNKVYERILSLVEQGKPVPDMLWRLIEGAQVPNTSWGKNALAVIKTVIGSTESFGMVMDEDRAKIRMRAIELLPKYKKLSANEAGVQAVRQAKEELLGVKTPSAKATPTTFENFAKRKGWLGGEEIAPSPQEKPSQPQEKSWYDNLLDSIGNRFNKLGE